MKFFPDPSFSKNVGVPTRISETHDFKEFLPDLETDQNRTSDKPDWGKNHAVLDGVP